MLQILDFLAAADAIASQLSIARAVDTNFTESILLTVTKGFDDFFAVVHVSPLLYIASSAIWCVGWFVFLVDPDRIWGP